MAALAAEAVVAAGKRWSGGGGRGGGEGGGLRRAAVLRYKAKSRTQPTVLHSTPFSSSSRVCAAISSAPESDVGPLNKVTTALTEQLYEYILKHTREPPALKRLREATAAMPGSRMQVTPEQGQLMAMLAQLVGATRAIEVGVYTGYSSACVALALPQDGLLVACENDAKVVKVAEKAWEDAGVRHKVDLRIAPAAETLNKLVEEGQTDSFDLAFVDADKRNYGLYYELLLKLVRPGGLIAIDNVFWYGKVADLQVDDKATVAIRELTDSLFVDERISFTLVPVGDGMALCRRR